MIYGIGTDITKVSRFEKWVKDFHMLKRFFNECEIIEGLSENETEKKMQYLCEHYAGRFAAKEAFSKALGTGFTNLELCDFGIKNDENGRPFFVFGKKTSDLITEKCGKFAKVLISISHEKEFAVSFVTISTEE